MAMTVSIWCGSIWRRTAPSAARAVRRSMAMATAVGLSALPSLPEPAAAQGMEWQPFREQDERAARRRPSAQPPPATLPPLERSDIERRPNDPSSAVVSPSGAPLPWAGANSDPSAGRRPSTVDAGNSQVERVELPPIEGAPVFTGPRAAAASDSPRGAPQTEAPASGPITSLTPSQAAPQTSARPLPKDTWRGVDMRQLEGLIGPLELPPKSVALHALWARLMTADAAAPAGGPGPSHFLAVQMEALYRSGLTGAMGERIVRANAERDDPLIAIFTVRLALADGDTAKACENTRRLAARRGGLPKLLQGEVHILSGYCAGVQGNAGGAGLAAELAREDEVEAPFALQVLDAIGASEKGAKLVYPKRLNVLEYRLLEVLGQIEPQKLLAAAEPALLNAIANADNADPRLTVAAAEAAAAIHALGPEGLSEVYAAFNVPANSGASGGADALFRRAVWFKALKAEQQPQKKLQLARQLVDDAGRSGFGLVMARAVSGLLADVPPGPISPGLGADMIVAVEAAIASGQFGRARLLAGSLPEAQAWLVLADIADPNSQGVSDGALAAVEALARAGRFDAVALHRLATVLDAIDVNVPVPLWEAASRTPAPNSGHLPETGTLPQLQEAARKGEIGKTALLVMRTIGPGGPGGANLIALGDSIRALRRAGLEADARALALEALYADWPRGR